MTVGGAHPLSVADSDGHVEGTSLGSLDGMNATTLRDRVQAELIAQDLTWTALQKRARVSQKTIEALRKGTERAWGHTTLNKIDEALGLELGTLYRIFEDDKSRPSAADVAEIAAQMRLMQTKLAEMTERPWAAEAIAVLAELDPADRYRVIDLARQLARR